MEKVIFLKREELLSRSGYALPSNRKVFVRRDLPNGVRKFVLAHELYHLQDGAYW
jgi:hypothetical protein